MGGPSPASMLPARLTSFIGREKELTELVECVPNTPLITLVGAGGTGKTRLALEAASVLSPSFEDAVWFVDLAQVTDAALVPHSVATVVGVDASGPTTPADAVARRFETRAGLLILDNCEHVIEACSALVAKLVAKSPSLRIIATSREPLGIGGEMLWSVRPLGIPVEGINDLDLEEIGTYEAVRLFVDRIRLVDRAFTLDGESAPVVARICRRLDGIPLAVELAAARIRTLGLRQLADRLDQHFGILVSTDRTATDRQRTIRDLVAWSDRLLDPDERLGFHRLSVCPGGFTIELAERIVGESSKNVLELVTSLVDKSLIHLEEGKSGSSRYRMLEPIRQYAAEQITEDACDLRKWMTTWALDTVRASVESETDDVARSTFIEREYTNLREVLDWALEAADAEVAASIGSALGQVWRTRGRLAEGRLWLHRILALKIAPDERTKMLNLDGRLALEQSDYEEAESAFRRALDLAREQQDTSRAGDALIGLGRLSVNRGDTLAARQILEECMSLAADGRERKLEAEALGALAYAEERNGDLPKARAHLMRALSIFREEDRRRSEATTLNSLGLVAMAERNFAEAERYFQDTLSIWEEFGDQPGIATVLLNLGAVAENQGRSDRAQVLFQRALDLAGEIGMEAVTMVCLHNLAIVASRVWDYARAEDHLKRCIRIARRTSSEADLVHGLDALAEVAVAQARYEDARRLYSEALEITERRQHQRALVDLLAALADLAAKEGKDNELSDIAARITNIASETSDRRSAMIARDVRAAALEREGKLEESLGLLKESLTDLPPDTAPRFAAVYLLSMARLRRHLESPAESRSAVIRALELERSLNSGPACVPALEELGILAAVSRPEQAARLLAGTQAIRDKARAPLPASTQPDWDAAVESISRATGRDRFEEVWASGRAMSLDRLVDLALSDESEGASSYAEPSPPNQHACTFRKEGDVWTIAYRETATRLKDVKGLAYLAMLIQSAGREIHVMDLVGTLEGHAPRTASEPDLEVGAGDAGEILDADARNAYRARLAELAEEVEEADTFNDPERAARARAEMDALVDQLKAGVGLGGRNRKAASDAERARGSVSKAIRSALDRIERDMPDLGRRLRSCVTTGTFCSYVPDKLDPIDWDL